MELLIQLGHRFAIFMLAFITNEKLMGLLFFFWLSFYDNNDVDVSSKNDLESILPRLVYHYVVSIFQMVASNSEICQESSLLHQT